MRYALLLFTLWLSVAGGAEQRDLPPWELDWAQNPGDCVGVGEMPRGVSCKLYAHGGDGFEMRIYVYEESQSRDVRVESFFDIAARLCNALETPVSIMFFAKKQERRMMVKPPSCEKPITS